MCTSGEQGNLIGVTNPWLLCCHCWKSHGWIADFFRWCQFRKLEKNRVWICNAYIKSSWKNVGLVQSVFLDPYIYLFRYLLVLWNLGITDMTDVPQWNIYLIPKQLSVLEKLFQKTLKSLTLFSMENWGHHKNWGWVGMQFLIGKEGVWGILC